jgi:hypothetical protein
MNYYFEQYLKDHEASCRSCKHYKAVHKLYLAPQVNFCKQKAEFHDWNEPCEQKEHAE